ncbi:N-acetylmuramoyl-L-alanine amidase [bacterium]|nr:N-acetylmuramoyl-L-alanine amidase [bacterium]
MTAFASPNHGARRGGAVPKLIVLHYTGMPSCAEARERLCDPVHEVSAHWLLDLDGRAEQLVDEGRRAWHAGAGSWGSVSDVNSASIGIEIQNVGHVPFPEPQMAALEGLLRGIMARWSILPQGVIAHSDMAPTRKADPGPHFDWRRLARAGLSVWPETRSQTQPQMQPPTQPLAGAGRVPFATSARIFGYPEAEPQVVLHAFRLRFRPWARGPLDDVDAALAADLAARFPAA